MERLTYRDENGKVHLKSYNGVTFDAADRLAAYEDAEEQGSLIRLPQKTVYAIGWVEGKDCDYDICPASIDGAECCYFCENSEPIVYEEECCQEHLPRIGKTVFLTREEAEAALAKEGHDD